jgi:hypothetical protein
MGASAMEDRERMTYHVPLAFLVILIPFLVPIPLLHGLNDAMPTFNGNDETIGHWPIIKRWIASWPHMSYEVYESATPPLFHIVLATVGRWVSSDLAFLRGVNVLFSYLAAGAFFWLCWTRLHLDQATAFLAALVFALAPYFYGGSFLLLTDNLATLFAILALMWCLSFRESGRLEHLVYAAAFAAAAIMTRQLYAWLVPVMALLVVEKRQWPGFVLIGLAVFPLGFMFALWGGFMPDFDRWHQGLNLASSTFLLACVGAYGLPFILPVVRLQWWMAPCFGAIALALLVAAPLIYHLPPADCPSALCGPPTIGLIWRIANLFPTLFGSSLLFYLLVPAGLIVLWHARHDWFALAIFASYALICSTHAAIYQKYYEVVALLIALIVGLRKALPLYHRPLLIATAVAFALYAAGNPFFAAE